MAGIEYWRAAVLGADTAPIRAALASIFDGEPIGEWIKGNPRDEELRTRPGDFGADFLGRALPAVLYSGADYVQAQRERRLMLAEMAPIYQRYDLLITPTAPGPPG